MKNLAESLGTFGYFVYLCNGFVVKLPKIRPFKCHTDITDLTDHADAW